MNYTALIVLAFGILVFLCIFSFAYFLVERRPNLEKRVRQQGGDEERKGFRWQSYLDLSRTVLKHTGEIVPRSPQEMSRQERRLTQAGIRRRDAPILLTGAKVMLIIGFAIFFLIGGYMQKQPVLCLLVSLFFGLLVPDIWLNHRIITRKEGIQLALPDALDLMVMCVEAGLSLDQTLSRIAPELRGNYSDLSDEFQLYTLEVTAGKKRDDALRNLGRRSGTDDLKALTSALMQANRFGVAIAQSLRVFSESMRTKRRQRLEERAAKMSIKMLFPLVCCIFPGIFIVLIGPAVLQIIASLTKM
jgi:tight adherence protein C